MQRPFSSYGRLPKSRYWRRTAQRNHPEATQERIMATLQRPTLPVREQEDGKTAYFAWLEEDGCWFRVVLDERGALYTAFRDDATMLFRGRL